MSKRDNSMAEAEAALRGIGHSSLIVIKNSDGSFLVSSGNGSWRRFEVEDKVELWRLIHDWLSESREV